MPLNSLIDEKDKKDCRPKQHNQIHFGGAASAPNPEQKSKKDNARHSDKIDEKFYEGILCLHSAVLQGGKDVSEVKRASCENHSAL